MGFIKIFDIMEKKYYYINPEKIIKIQINENNVIFWFGLKDYNIIDKDSFEMFMERIGNENIN